MYSVKQVVYQLVPEAPRPPHRRRQPRRTYRTHYITVASNLTFQQAKEIRKRHRNSSIVMDRFTAK